jgi:hypothetical protein
LYREKLIAQNGKGGIAGPNALASAPASGEPRGGQQGGGMRSADWDFRTADRARQRPDCDHGPIVWKIEVAGRHLWVLSLAKRRQDVIPQHDDKADSRHIFERTVAGKEKIERKKLKRNT